MVKDLEAFEKQVSQQHKETKKLREELNSEIKRREDLVEQ